MSKREYSYFDVEELAAYICGLNPDEAESGEIEEALQEGLLSYDNGCLDAFDNIIEKLIPLIDVGESPMTGKRFKGFCRTDDDGRKLWIVKTEITPDE